MLAGDLGLPGPLTYVLLPLNFILSLKKQTSDEHLTFQVVARLSLYICSSQTDECSYRFRLGRSSPLQKQTDSKQHKFKYSFLV